MFKTLNKMVLKEKEKILQQSEISFFDSISVTDKELKRYVAEHQNTIFVPIGIKRYVDL